MNDIKKNIRRIFVLFCVLFALVILYLCKYILVDSKTIVTNSYNPRLKLMDEGVTRGLITDTSGVVLAGNDNGERVYPYGRKLAHLVGTTQMGKTGVEYKYNFLLQHPSNEIIQRIRGLMSGEHISGDTAVLTVDAELQELASSALGQNRGAVVVMEPSTGRVLAMVSQPDFDPSTVDANWEVLKNDTDNSPLLNRATQGLYPPGSIFKLFTATAGLENGLDGFTFECTGEAEFDGERIRCFNSKAHGSVDMAEALALSCNGYFAALALEIGPEALREVCDRVYFDRDLEYPIERGRSSFSLADDAETALIMQTAIGQGQTLVTPLHMAMAVSAIANGGLMMKPYVLEKQLDAYGAAKTVTMPTALGQVFDYDEAETLTSMMIGAVETGTAAPAAVKGVKIAAKTGTAENAGGDDHGWVVAFAPAEAEPGTRQIAIAVVLENSGGPRKGLELVKKVVEAVVE